MAASISECAAEWIVARGLEVEGSIVSNVLSEEECWRFPS